jgi:hypothetical protein
MTTELGPELIEGYLRTRRVQYFRGHHDEEYFFLINAYYGRLHVHLEACGPDRDAVKVSVTAPHYFPAEQRARVTAVAAQWNHTSPWAEAIVYASCDPRLVGVAAENRYSRTDTGDFAAFVDQTIQSAIELFGRMRVSVGPASASTMDEALLDAG